MTSNKDELGQGLQQHVSAVWPQCLALAKDEAMAFSST